MGTHVRPARVEDTAFLAWAMLESSRSHLPRGAWDVFLDAPDAICLRFLEQLACAEPRTFCHWRGFLVAEVDGVAAATVSGFDPGAMADAVPAIEAALVTLGWTKTEITAANGRFAPFFTCVPPWTAGLWRVEWVATRPEFRRRGLAELLVRAVLEHGRHAGHRIAQLAVLVGNTPAMRAYEKVGFHVECERRHPDFEAALDCPGIVEMRLAL